MRSVTGGVVGLAVLVGVCGWTFGQAPKASPSAGASAAAKKTDVGPVAEAAKALLKEYQTVMKEKKGDGLREKSDYFGEKKPEGVSAETVLAVIEKPIPGVTDGRAEAYVKWQLLSGVGEKFPEALRQRAVAAYQKAPKPRASPGLDRMGLDRKLNRDVGRMNKDAEAEVNKGYQELIMAWRLEIEPILSYSDDFYAKLPPSYDTFVAGLTDVYDRVTRGAPANEFWTTVGNGIRSWALTATDSRQLGTMAKAVSKLMADVKSDRNKPYSVVRWEQTNDYMGLKWHSEQTIRELRSIEDVAVLLEERSQNPGGAGGLGFKDEKEMKKK